MLYTAVARRYAQALFGLAQEKGMMDQIEGDLALVVQTLRENSDVQRVVQHQDIPPEAKIRLVKEIFQGKVSPLTLNFLGVVLSKRREEYLPDIYNRYLEQANITRGVVEAEVRSAVPLAQEQTEALAQRLGTKLGKTLKLKTRVEPALMGGIVVRVGDTLLDGSVRTRLQRLRERLLNKSDLQA